MPMTKEEKREYMKKYNEANKEKIKERKREYNIENKEKIKQYYLTNKERIKEYNIENKEKIKVKRKEYKQTATGKKKNKINQWINKLKIKFDDRNEAEYYYNSYINTHRCNWCDKEFKNSLDRQFDHCHTCGLPRAIICRVCNTKDVVPCVNCLL